MKKRFDFIYQGRMINLLKIYCAISKTTLNKMHDSKSEKNWKKKKKKKKVLRGWRDLVSVVKREPHLRVTKLRNFALPELCEFVESWLQVLMGQTIRKSTRNIIHFLKEDASHLVTDTQKNTNLCRFLYAFISIFDYYILVYK